MQHVKLHRRTHTHTHTHTHRHFIPRPKCSLSFDLVVTFAANASVCRLRPIRPSLVWISKSSSFTRSKCCQTLLSSGVVQWVLASSNGGLWLARVFGCGAVSCNNIHLARVQPTWKATIAQRWLPRPLFMQQQHTAARLKTVEEYVRLLPANQLRSLLVFPVQMFYFKPEKVGTLTV